MEAIQNAETVAPLLEVCEGSTRLGDEGPWSLDRRPQFP
jgi:hypothetical protein